MSCLDSLNIVVIRHSSECRQLTEPVAPILPPLSRMPLMRLSEPFALVEGAEGAGEFLKDELDVDAPFVAGGQGEETGEPNHGAL